MKTLIEFWKKFRPRRSYSYSENFQRFYSRPESNVPAGCKLLPDTKKATSPGNEVVQGTQKGEYIHETWINSHQSLILIG